jgi:hypothetical protein
MLTRTLTVALLLLVVAPLVVVRADLPRPWWEPRPDPIADRMKADAERLKRQAPLVITVEEKAETARLLIPRKLVKAWQHASLATPRNTAVASDRGWSLPTLAAGLALTLALTLGGLWLAGWRPGWDGPGARKVTALFLLAVLALGVLGALVRANFPPGSGPPLSPEWMRDAVAVKPIGPEPLRLKGKVEVEVVPEGELIQLFVPRSMLAPLTQQRPPEPPRAR